MISRDKFCLFFNNREKGMKRCLLVLLVLVWSLSAQASMILPSSLAELHFFGNSKRVEYSFIMSEMVDFGYENVMARMKYLKENDVVVYKVYVVRDGEEDVFVAEFTFKYDWINTKEHANTSVHDENPSFVFLKRGLSMKWVTKKELDDSFSEFVFHTCDNNSFNVARCN